METYNILPLMLLTNALVLFMFIIFLYIRKLNSSSMGSTHKLPPNPSKYPIIGNLHQLLGNSRHQALWQLSKEYGPIMQIHIGSKPFLIISSPAMAKQILQTQDHIFCSRPLYQATKRLTYNYLVIAFSPHSNHWREMRKLLVSEFLGPKRAKLSKHVLLTEIDNLVSSLSVNPSNVSVNLNNLFLEAIKGFVCKVAFGKNYRAQPLKGPSFEVMLNEFMEFMNGSIGDFFPWIGRFIDQFSGWNAKLNKYFSNFDAYIDLIVDEHHKHTIKETSDDEKDFVHTLFELYETQNASGYRLTKEDVKALVMDVLTGGIDTTVVTLVWAMSEIVRNTRIMQKLQSEIRICTGKKEKVHELDIKKMAYLKMVIKETLRLHPPGPLLIPHECLSDTKVGGYDVLSGTTVIINAWGIGRDPSTWGDNVNEFYPERFENLDVDFGGGNFEMVSFGGGRRSCPAMNIAPATIAFTLANMLYWFDWEVPGGMNNEDLNMQEEGSLVVRKKLPLYLVPLKHNWES